MGTGMEEERILKGIRMVINKRKKRRRR